VLLALLQLARDDHHTKAAALDCSTPARHAPALPAADNVGRKQSNRV
jgi:hypothetical protein